MIPWEVWSLMILLASVGTAYSWRFRDNENYTDIIAGFMSIVFWIICGISLFGGVVTESMTYANQYIAWLFIAIGIIAALITFTRATEVFHQKR